MNSEVKNISKIIRKFISTDSTEAISFCADVEFNISPDFNKGNILSLFTKCRVVDIYNKKSGNAVSFDPFGSLFGTYTINKPIQNFIEPFSKKIDDIKKVILLIIKLKVNNNPDIESLPLTGTHVELSDGKFKISKITDINKEVDLYELTNCKYEKIQLDFNTLLKFNNELIKYVDILARTIKYINKNIPKSIE